MPLSMPRDLVDAAEREGHQSWMAALPATVKILQERWALDLGEPFQPGSETA